MADTLASRLTALLSAYGVDMVFGIPGVHTAEIYRTLHEHRIRHVTPRHEQGAGFMADGYARVTGRPGVCLVITGPGLSNIATAMLQARADSIPMLVISSVVQQADIGSGRGGLHDMPSQEALAAALSIFSRTVTSASALDETIARAFALFESARPGPVHIQIPRDLLGAPIEASAIRRAMPARPPVPDTAAIAKTVAMIDEAQSPVIILGGGARRGGTAALALAEKLDCPILGTVNARSLLPRDHPLTITSGVNLPATRALVDNADLTLAFGTEMGPTDYKDWTTGEMIVPQCLIRVDIDPEQLFRNAIPDLALLGDAAATIAQLRDGVTAAARDGALLARGVQREVEANCSADQKRLAAALEAIRAAAPTAALVGDSTQLTYAGNDLFAVGDKGHWFNSATGFGTLGYGLPAGIGASLGRPDEPVVVLIGDGGIQFTLGELGALREVAGPMVVVVWNSDGYLEIRKHMEGNGIDPIGVDLPAPDFAMVAKAYGLGTEVIESPSGLGEAVARGLREGRPYLVEVQGV
ncbi:MAG: 5-guanidino-2-oxopentanoate decarboxylase [Pseudomonadota bacterium]